MVERETVMLKTHIQAFIAKLCLFHRSVTQERRNPTYILQLYISSSFLKPTSFQQEVVSRQVLDPQEVLQRQLPLQLRLRRFQHIVELHVGGAHR